MLVAVFMHVPHVSIPPDNSTNQGVSNGANNEEHEHNC